MDIFAELKRTLKKHLNFYFYVKVRINPIHFDKEKDVYSKVLYFSLNQTSFK